MTIQPASIDRFRSDLLGLGWRAGERLGVAVSGGPDSLALLLLANATLPDGVIALSIDHGLRAEAGAECTHVARICAALGIAHSIATVAVRRDGHGIQAAARVARRRAWHEWAAAEGIAWIATGHHLDDQAETVLMRLARGSGVAGLAGIAPVGRLGGMPEQQPVMLIRPLLSWSRAELGAIVADAGLVPVIDPSNTDPRHDRTRFRALLAETDLLDPRRLAAVARNLLDASDALDWTEQRIAGEHLRFDHGDADGAGSALLDTTGLPREFIRRLTMKAIAHLGQYPDDGPAIDRLIATLEAGRAATIRGIKATPRNALWHFAPAPPRRPTGPSRIRSA
ncbi:tRNA lysidine(34) synthetase TilS [Sphingomonas sp. 1P06PA]|uniref:tRNA lysidine(34) synthetase TilS n=1 Tax=Sphingomonas sp. 1P06PA TaxID=554121 RepID=UPI0039A4F5F6